MEDMLLIDKYLEGSQSGTHAVYKMEQKFQSYFENSHECIGMCNATLAITSVFIALGLKSGDKIISTPYTWGGTIAGALFMGLKVVFADIDKKTFTLSTRSVEQQLKKHKNVRLILDVDIFGNPSFSDEVNSLARQYNCFHLIDSAAGFGAYYKQKPSGFYADAVVLSFSESKNLNAGEGAVLCLKDKNLFEKVVYYTQHPYRAKRDATGFMQNQFALNFRIHPISAYVLLSRFDSALCSINEKCQKVLELFGLINSNTVINLMPFNPSYYKPAFNRICFCLNDSEKKELSNYLLKEHIPIELKQPSISLSLASDPILKSLGYHRLISNVKILPNVSYVLQNSIELTFKT
ncbi:MAG: DegT/DnrJ/EryC1/StrS family aminotransferase [Candidatus Thorarchaeota archaeon]